MSDKTVTRPVLSTSRHITIRYHCSLSRERVAGESGFWPLVRRLTQVYDRKLSVKTCKTLAVRCGRDGQECQRWQTSRNRNAS